MARPSAGRGIVFNTHSGRGHTSHSWVSFSIPMVTGSGERKAESGKRKSGEGRVSFSIPALVREYSFVVQLALPGIVFDTYVGVKCPLCVSGIVFDTCVGEGVFICGAARATGYRFRYPCLCGASIAHPLCEGIVFDTRGCVGLPLPTLYVWVSFSIPVVTGACFLWAGYCFRYP